MMDQTEPAKTLEKLKTQRESFCLEKRNIECQLADVRNLLANPRAMSPEERHTCLEEKTSLMRKMTVVEANLFTIKRQIQDLANEVYFANHIPRKEVVLMLREIRDKWQEVSADDALGNATERTLAAQFVKDINPIIHRLIESSER